MEGDGLVERDARVKGQVEDGRSAAGDEKEDQRVFFSLLKHGQRGFGCGERVLVGHRVAALEVANAPVAFPGQLVAAADAAQTLPALHALQQGFQHRPGSLAQSNDKDALVAGEIDRRRTAAVGQKPMHRVALKANAPVKGRCDVTGLHCAFKDLSRRGVQSIQGSIADWGHGSCSFSQPASACCISSS